VSMPTVPSEEAMKPKPWKPSRKAVEEAMKVFDPDWSFIRGKLIGLESRQGMRRAMMVGAKIDGVGK